MLISSSVAILPIAVCNAAIASVLVLTCPSFKLLIAVVLAVILGLKVEAALVAASVIASCLAVAIASEKSTAPTFH